jgi:hypothetical protein
VRHADSDVRATLIHRNVDTGLHAGDESLDALQAKALRHTIPVWGKGFRVKTPSRPKRFVTPCLFGVKGLGLGFRVKTPSRPKRFVTPYLFRV